MIERFDENDDGQLTQDEIRENRNEGRIFARLDADDDGVISKSEFEDGRKMMRNRMRERRDN